MSAGKTPFLPYSDRDRPMPLANKLALAQLADEIEALTTQCYSVGALTLSAIELPNSVLTLNSLPALSRLLQQQQKVTQVYVQMKSMLDAFECAGVIITPRLTVPGQGSLDLLVRFPVAPKKANFAIALRAKTNSKVVYHEAQEALFFRRERGGLKRWNPDHLMRLPMQESWLRKNQVELFGSSAKDKNRPLIKLLVLTGETAIGQHSDHLYTTVGKERVLLIRRQSSTYIMHESQLIPFIQAWLEKRS